MKDFNVWYEYMVKKGYMSDTVNKALLEKAFDAGAELGYWEGMEFVAGCEGLSATIKPPFWYAPEN